MHLRRSEDNFWESLLFFHHVGPGNGIHPLGHLSSPVSYFLVSACMLVSDTRLTTLPWGDCCDYLFFTKK